MTILLPVAQKCAAFICRNSPEELTKVEKLVEDSIQGFFHYIADSIAYSMKVELLKTGIILSDDEGFKPAIR